MPVLLRGSHNFPTKNERKSTTLLGNGGSTVIAPITPLAATILPLPHTRGLVLEGSGIRFVVFAGTDPLVLANWVSDFDFSDRRQSS
jgi:hypothetical protein